MTITIPESVTAEGNVKAVFVETVANINSPTVAELEAGTDISCFLMPDWDGSTATQSTGESRRFCSRESFARLGRVSREIAPLSYTYKPQEIGNSDPANAVYEALAPDTTGVLYLRYGLGSELDFEAGQIVDGFPVEAGVQNKGARGADEFAPLTVTQTLGVTGSAATDAVVAA